MVYFPTKKIWVNFLGLVTDAVGIFYGRLVWGVLISYILPILLFWTNKNLATLLRRRIHQGHATLEKGDMKMLTHAAGENLLIIKRGASHK
jgi:hypothetical protein